MFEVVPQNSTSTSFVSLRMSGSGCNPALSFERDGYHIDLRETIDCYCIALGPPYLLSVNIGQLPAGEYTVDRTLHAVPVETACDVEQLGAATYNFTVSQAVVPPPALVPISGPASLGLVLALMVCAALFLRHRSGL